MGGSEDTTICPQCGGEYKRVGSHWAASSTCDYAEPSAEQRDILEAVLMVAGTISRSPRNGSSDNPYVQIVTHRREFLDWLDDQLGILTTGVRHHQDASEVRESFAAFTDKDVSESDINDQYALSSRSLPFLIKYYNNWYDEDGNRTIPEYIDPSPTKRRILYALVGHVTDSGPYTAIEHTFQADIDRSTLDRFYGDFGPSYSTTEDGTTLVTLTNPARLLDHIGTDPLPGFADKWPDPETFEMPDEECPACHGRYDMLSSHFVKSTACPTPGITPEQHEVITGLLLAGATLDRADTTNAARLRLASTNREYLDWVADRLGWLVNSVRESTSEADARAQFESWTDQSNLDGYDIKAKHTLTTVVHPELYDRYADWFDDPRAFLADLDPTPLRCKLVFARRGTVHAYHEYTETANISTGRIPMAQADILAFFDAFSPRFNKERLVITDKDAFLDYIGDPIPGCEARWQPGDTVNPRHQV